MSVFVFAVVMGGLLTALTRWFCLRWEIYDVPNQRSAHTTPTPTLGGVALVVGVWFVLGYCYVMDVGLPDRSLLLGLLFASVVLCVLVWDEVVEMRWWRKLGLQVLAAVVMVWQGVYVEALQWHDQVFVLGMWGMGMSVVGLIVIQNLYNFMDGLDGFAALEGVLVAGILAILFGSVAPELSHLMLAVCGVSLGFWFWNKPLARIFMGDVGAHFLPLCFGFVALVGQRVYDIPAWITLLPLGTFLLDAVYTLVRRFLRGENVTQAHRFHIYQRLQQLGWSPWAINAVYALFTLVFGIDALIWQAGVISWAYGVLGVVFLIAMMGIIWVEFRFKALEMQS